MATHDSTANATAVPARTKVKPRSLDLYPHEVVQLVRNGEATIVRPVFNMPFQSSDDPERWLISDGRREGWLTNRRLERVYDRETKKLISEREYYFSKDELLMKTCPLGPVGSTLWGRESFSVGLVGDLAFIDYRSTVAGDRPLSHPITGELFDRLESKRKGWRPASHMPIEASRFPRLIHETCEVKGVDDINWGHLMASPVEARHGRSYWCSLVRKVDAEVADA